MFQASKKGFTLIELLVVISIIGVLATVVLASLNSARAKARDARRRMDVDQIKKQLEIYYFDNGYYPSTGWMNSSVPSQWTSFGSLIGASLPEDPINTGAPAANGASPGYTYSFYGGGFGCPGQWYMITYRLETEANPASLGVNRCDSTSKFNYTGTITTGVNVIKG